MMHFEFLLKAFKDERYVKIDGKPLLYIFNPKDLPQEYVDNFKKWTVEAGFPGLLLVAQLGGLAKKEDYLKKGYDLVSYQRLAGKSIKKKYFKGYYHLFNLWNNIVSFMKHVPPRMEDYSKVYCKLIQPIDSDNDVIPAILPQWDHSPRSGWNGQIFINATPDVFYKHVKEAMNAIKDKPENRQILFLKSWNEWGEGNMMEPDLTYGRGFIEALRKAVDEY